MTDKILLVDDDFNCLNAYKRSHGRHFKLDVAQGGDEGLKAITQRGPYAVIVSDMQMPGMDGVEFLSRARKISPDTTRIMLTGNADQGTAVEAVNRGSIAFFLSKPCDKETFIHAVNAGVEQYRRLNVERELLENTLRGSIGVLTEVLSILNPEAFDHALKIKDMARRFAKLLEMERSWELELAAMLSPIGYVTIPPEVFSKFTRGEKLDDNESKILGEGPVIGCRLINKIPRLENVAQVILHQHKHFDGSGASQDGIRGKDLPLGSRVLKILADYVELEADGKKLSEAMPIMRERRGWYDVELLEKILAAIIVPPDIKPIETNVFDCRLNQILAQDIETKQGAMIIRAGQVITQAVKQSLKNYYAIGRIEEKFHVIDRNAVTNDSDASDPNRSVDMGNVKL